MRERDQQLDDARLLNAENAARLLADDEAILADLAELRTTGRHRYTADLMRAPSGSVAHGSGGSGSKARRKRNYVSKKAQLHIDERYIDDTRFEVYGLSPAVRNFYRRRQNDARRILVRFVRSVLNDQRCWVTDSDGKVIGLRVEGEGFSWLERLTQRRREPSTDFIVIGLPYDVHDRLTAFPGAARLALTRNAETFLKADAR